VDGLAKAYTAKPVVFLQYETDSPHAVHRIDRFMAAWQLDKSPAELKPSTPHTMVDSGREISYGERDYQKEYRRMVDGELLRPPGALVVAARERPDTRTLIVMVQVTNISTTTLETAVNGATVHAVVYDGSKALKAGSDIRAASQAYFEDPCPPGETREFAFTFTNLPGTNLSRADALVIVDYVPEDGQGRWDMLQAALAGNDPLPPIPTAMPTPTMEPTLTPIPPPTAEPTAVPTVKPTQEPERHTLFMPRLLRRWAGG
jgi:hypothetical protein